MFRPTRHSVDSGNRPPNRIVLPLAGDDGRIDTIFGLVLCCRVGEEPDLPPAPVRQPALWTDSLRTATFACGMSEDEMSQGRP